SVTLALPDALPISMDRDSLRSARARVAVLEERLAELRWQHGLDRWQQSPPVREETRESPLALEPVARTLQRSPGPGKGRWAVPPNGKAAYDACTAQVARRSRKRLERRSEC